MDVTQSLKRLGKLESVLRSLVFKSVVDVFNEKKQIDISSKIISVTQKNNTFYIKTQNPMINTELELLFPEIQKSIREKWKVMWVEMRECELRGV